MTNAVTKPVDPMREFQEKIVAKVREDIAKMLPKEAIEQLVQRAVDEAFFKDREHKDGYGHVSREPSYFVEAIAEAAEPLMKASIERFIIARSDIIDKALEKFLDEKSLMVLALAVMQNHIRVDMSNFAIEVANHIKQGY